MGDSTGVGDLLERDEASEALHRALADARTGRGGVALVAGEAGIGKTSLVRDFVEHAAGRPTVLVGACDPVETPRPLGPLIDAAYAVDSELAADLAAGMPRAAAFAAALELIVRGSEPTVLVLEDLHWADEATLDVFTFLGRRIDDRPALVVATYRDDEVDVRHPLRIRLADVHPHVRARIQLSALSTAAIARLADDAERSIDVDALRDITGGNPFFVTEILADRGDDQVGEHVPASVRDAVLARATRLPDDARAVLDAASILPGAVEPWLLDALADQPGIDVSEGLDTCIDRGLLRFRADGRIEFRHELARHATDEVIRPAQRRRLHERAYQLIFHRPGPPDHARLAHHAIAADAGAGVIAHAPIAAEDATNLGSNADAARLLEAALRYEHLLDPRAAAQLWGRLGRVRGQLSQDVQSLDAYRRGCDLAQASGDLELQAELTCRAGRALYYLGRGAEAEHQLLRAEQLLGGDPPPSRAALVVALDRCSQHMLAREPEQCELVAQRAMPMAEQLGDDVHFARLAIQSGISLCMAGDDRGLARIREGIAVGRRIGDDALVALGYGQIGTGYGELRRYDIAIPALREGIEFTRARELVSEELYETVWLARCELETGDWQAAGQRADATLRHPRCTGIIRLIALYTLAWLRMRRGDPGVDELLDEAVGIGRDAGHVQRFWPAAACHGEHAWMTGSADRSVLDEAMRAADDVAYLPAIEELSHWLALIDGTPRGETEAPRTPFGLSAAGNWERALDAWLSKGCPYEAAFCRFVIGGPDHLRGAYRAFDELGAVPMRDRTAVRLREIGARVPRGVHKSTRENPHGLTDRELEVLSLLPSGKTNAEIGDALFISSKTAGHHVSKVLSKLDVASRAEAAAVAERLGITA